MNFSGVRYLTTNKWFKFLCWYVSQSRSRNF